MDVIFHIGSSKCGSSALQTALTGNPVMRTRDGRRVVYGAITPLGDLVHGADVVSVADRLRGYASCPGVSVVQEFGRAEWQRLKDDSKTVNADTLILSDEGYVHAPELFQRFGEIFEQIRSIFIVRPQVDFMNAGYWQWGAWTGRTLEAWVRSRLPKTLWKSYIDEWTRVSGAPRPTIRLLDADIVSDFCRWLGVIKKDRPRTTVVNKGLSADILRLYQRNRILRRTPHDSQIDFVLSRALTPSGKPPWVIHLDLAATIIEAARDDNTALLDELGPGDRVRMENDSRWWDAEAYADRAVESWQPQPVAKESLERLCVELARALLRSERQAASSRSELGVNRPTERRDFPLKVIPDY